MSNSCFQFKQFKINQDRCAMKVGTDGVLLGTWTDVSGVQSILDVGTGTGLIALMLAQRSSAAIISGIEIDGDAAAQAVENVNNSPWREKINIEAVSLQTFTKNTGCRFDLIVSNPPYFNKSLKNPDAQRSVARHSDLLSRQDLLTAADTLLRFCPAPGDCRSYYRSPKGWSLLHGRKRPGCIVQKKQK